MSETSFTISSEVSSKPRRDKIDYIGELRTAFRRPIEATWLPSDMMIACNDAHALLSAIKIAFYHHLPLRLTPDAIWITLARGFALHVNEHSEELRHRFVSHSGKETIIVSRSDFFLGEENPWPEAFEEFSGKINKNTGGLASLLQADFSTTGPIERAVSNLMVMDTFKSYFEYELIVGCGIPQITLSGTLEDWEKIRSRAQEFADYGLEEWIQALDPILEQFVKAKKGEPDIDFWKSFFRYHSGSGPAVMTGWVNVLFPYFKNGYDQLYPNPYLKDWLQRLVVDTKQHFTENWNAPQGVGLSSIPSCFTSVPLTVILNTRSSHFWSKEKVQKVQLRLVGGLMGVTQRYDTYEVQPECGWVVLHEEPVDPISPHHQRLEDNNSMQEPN